MDVFKAVEMYISKMVSEPSAMKVLLLDTHTVRGDVPLISAAQELTSYGSRRHRLYPRHPLSRLYYRTKST